MQLNYPTAIPAERAIILPAPRVALPNTVRTPALVRAPALRWLALDRKRFGGQMWETAAWLALALSAFVALLTCMDI